MNDEDAKLFIMGRGAGKTRLTIEWYRELLKQNPPAFHDLYLTELPPAPPKRTIILAGSAEQYRRAAEELLGRIDMREYIGDKPEKIMALRRDTTRIVIAGNFLERFWSWHWHNILLRFPMDAFEFYDVRLPYTTYAEFVVAKADAMKQAAQKQVIIGNIGGLE